MKKLRHVKHDTSLIYCCPNCKTEHWRTMEEVMTGQPMLVCWCGLNSKIEKITKPRFVVEYAKTVRKTKTSLVPDVPPNLGWDVASAASLIRAQGFSSSETERYIKSAMQKNTPQSVAELVRLALMEVENVVV